MTDSDIIAMAQLRYRQIESDLRHGEFDLYLSPQLTACVLVYEGQIKHIIVPNRAEGYRKKILPDNNNLG